MIVTLAKVPVQPLSMSIGNCVVEKKGYTQEDFAKLVTTDLLAQLRNELEFSCSTYGRKELL